MADDIKKALTLDQVRSAAQFGPELCGPVATLIRGFEERLPPEQVLILGTELGVGSAYLAAGSGLAEYYLRALQSIKKKVKGEGIRPEFFARQYDPAIAFFKAQIARRRAITIRCRGDGAETASATMVPLSKGGVDPQAIRAALKDRFGIAVKALREVWPGHRAFMSDIRKGKDLVIVVAELHHDRESFIAYTKLLERLLRQKDRIDLRHAQEDEPVSAKTLLAELAASDIYRSMKRMHDEGKGITELFVAHIDDERVAKGFCAEVKKKRPDMPAALCMTNYFLPSMLEQARLAVVDADPDRLWKLDDGRLKLKALSLAEKYRGKPQIPAEERFSASLAFRELQVQRSVVMAHNLVRRAHQKEGTDKKPRIILFNVGASHALDVIRILQAKENLSVIGLVPDNYATFLQDIAEAPMK